MSPRAQRSAPRRCRQGPPLAPAERFERTDQGSGVRLQMVDRAGPGQFPGRGDHPDGEVVMRDIQLHGSPEECRNGWLELPAGEELESRAEGPVVNEDT